MVTHDISAIAVHANKLVSLGEKGFIVHDISLPITEETMSEIYGYGVYVHSHNCRNCMRKILTEDAIC
jgi:zinc transport system ATP-binding protein